VENDSGEADEKTAPWNDNREARAKRLLGENDSASDECASGANFRAESDTHRGIAWE
jgi:hypothetical protein